MLEKEFEADETSSSSENEPYEDGKDDFFGSLFVDKRSRKGKATKIAASFLNEPPTKSALPYSAAVERLFSTGRDILRLKKAGLSNEQFNVLVFLKGNFNK